LTPIQITQAAAEDLLTGYQFYEQQQHEIGRYFPECLTNDISNLGQSAGTHFKPLPSIYRALSKRFLFAIYYRYLDHQAVAIAVLDCRQDPKSIMNRFA